MRPLFCPAVRASLRVDWRASDTLNRQHGRRRAISVAVSWRGRARITAVDPDPDPEPDRAPDWRRRAACREAGTASFRAPAPDDLALRRLSQREPGPL